MKGKRDREKIFTAALTGGIHSDQRAEDFMQYGKEQ
jgi:hypothetical protein